MSLKAREGLLSVPHTFEWKFSHSVQVTDVVIMYDQQKERSRGMGISFGGL